MKVNAVASARVASVMNDPIVDRLHAVKRGLKKHGAVVLQDNPVDTEVLQRLQKQMDVNIQKSNTIRVSVK